MTTTPQPVRGTQSLIGEEADRFHAVIAAFDRVRRLYGFKRVEVPVIEPTAVFARTMGETTDVVSKEMYSFDDRSGDSDHAAARIHRRDRARLSIRRLAAICAIEGRDPRPRLPLRAPAKGPLPPVPPARCRNHRRRRAAGGCRGDRARRAIAGRTRHRGRDPQAQHAGRPRDPLGVARCTCTNILPATGTTCPKTAATGSSAIRCASSTARRMPTGRSPTARR